MKNLILLVLFFVGLTSTATDNAKPKHQLVVTLVNSDVYKVRNIINEKYRMGYKVVQLEMDSFRLRQSAHAQDEREAIIVFESK